ncbi:MAG: class B sortase [Erysipelotrichaceae bacterium]|nr:class B sortase [Erysipelotrichaceae bacterium]
MKKAFLIILSVFLCGCGKMAGSVLPPVGPVAPSPADLEAYKHEVNSDYIGLLEIEGLLEENVVQGEDNNEYLSVSWDRQEDSSGAIFLDFLNTLNDQNLIMYGHYVYADEDKRFSPLEKLMDEDNYEAYKNISLTLSDETRNYVITDVFKAGVDDTTLSYYLPAYEPEYFVSYYEAVGNASLYSTPHDLTTDDTWLTLQTCVRNEPDQRLVILARQI